MQARALKETVAWLGALALAVALITLARYSTRDPDSSLHVAIATRLSAQPLARWIAPEWWGNWSMSGLYREHPAGIFWLPAFLTRLGYPARQAAYAVNTLYVVLTILLIHRLSALFVTGREARALSWLLQLIPIAFTYRIRANHEQVVLLCFLAALYGIERSRKRASWGLLTAAALVGLMLVKGVLCVFIPIGCAALLLSDRKGGGMKRAWAVLLLAVAVALACASAYDRAYLAVTGEGFIEPYLRKQLGVAALPHGESFVAQKLENLAWYAARVFWFAFPWSIAWLAFAWRRFRDSSPMTPPEGPASQARRAAVFCLGMAALYVLIFSFSDRKADRYILPAYFLVGASGAVMALRRWPRLRRFTERLDARQPWTTITVFLATIILHLAGGFLHLPRIKFWPSD